MNYPGPQQRIIYSGAQKYIESIDHRNTEKYIQRIDPGQWLRPP